MSYLFLVNLMQKLLKIGQYLQKLLQKVYCHVFYAPQCITDTVAEFNFNATILSGKTILNCPTVALFILCVLSSTNTSVRGVQILY